MVGLYTGTAHGFSEFSPCQEPLVSTNAKANSSSHSAAHNIINVFVTAGDNYLKPYVSCEPEVSVTDRTAEDDCLILASDGLWDVVSNETACGVARMCLRGKAHAPPRSPMEDEAAASDTSDKACSDASMLLTKLALARHSTDNVSVVVVDLRRDT